MTSKPILYCQPCLTPCRGVLMTAAEIGIDLDLRVIDLLNREHRSPEFERISPQRVIPVLDDNGTIVIDSHLICMYMADKYSTNEHLYPKDLNGRNAVLTQLFYNCGHLTARVRKIFEPIMWFGCTELNTESIQYLKKSYDGLEACLRNSPFLCGQFMTIADLCCITTTVSTGNDFAPIDAKKYPNVLAWLEKMSELPYYKHCNRDGADLMYKIVMATMEENRNAWE